MRKSIQEGNGGRILIQLLREKKTVYIGLDKKGCEFLIEELKGFLIDSDSKPLDYDPETGFACGILMKDSLGLMIDLLEE